MAGTNFSNPILIPAGRHLLEVLHSPTIHNSQLFSVLDAAIGPGYQSRFFDPG